MRTNSRRNCWLKLPSDGAGLDFASAPWNLKSRSKRKSQMIKVAPLHLLTGWSSGCWANRGWFARRESVVSETELCLEAAEWAVSSSALGVVSSHVAPSVRTEGRVAWGWGSCSRSLIFHFYYNLDNKVVCTLNLQSTGSWTDVKDKIALEFKIVLSTCRNGCSREEMVGKEKILFEQGTKLGRVKQLHKFRVVPASEHCFR